MNVKRINADLDGES